MAASILMRPVNQWVVVRDSLEEPNFKHVNSGGPPVNGFACLRRRFGSAQNSNFSKVLAQFRAGC
jgi:hypothetical protein